jgi:hypothetical protein
MCLQNPFKTDHLIQFCVAVHAQLGDVLEQEVEAVGLTLVSKTTSPLVVSAILGRFDSSLATVEWALATLKSIYSASPSDITPAQPSAVLSSAFHQHGIIYDRLSQLSTALLPIVQSQLPPQACSMTLKLLGRTYKVLFFVLGFVFWELNSCMSGPRYSCEVGDLGKA